MSEPTLRRTVAGLAAIAAVFVGGVVAVPGAAQASTTRGECTVTPLKPIFAGNNSAGIRQADFRIKVSCAEDRRARIHQQVFEKDVQENPFDADDKVGGVEYYTFETETTSGSTTLHNVRTVPDTDWWPGDDIEELYHSVRFRVTSNGVQSPFTAWEASATTAMQQ